MNAYAKSNGPVISSVLFLKIRGIDHENEYEYDWQKPILTAIIIVLLITSSGDNDSNALISECDDLYDHITG
ncbi:Hypothetical predicted protein [Mytilus galloprovincialis]|uniref:Uncharacterized protein n=1 Tax=Mytilus galloprovincialis TaxID=29158 RepID=A0A8B6HMI7_MYTGA|nr:Hypothetical predicted protein [Mytilus galloprovincialis]